MGWHSQTSEEASNKIQNYLSIKRGCEWLMQKFAESLTMKRAVRDLRGPRGKV